MKNMLLTKVLEFLRKNLRIIILVMIMGNLFYYFKSDELTGSYYSGTIKIRSNSTFYDRLHTVLSKNANERVFKNGIMRKYHSYHNEDHYIFEINILSRDSSLIYSDGLSVIDSVQKDTMINNYFYQRLYTTEMLKKQNTKALEKIMAEEDKGALIEFIRTNLMINEFNLGNNLINIHKELLIHPYSPTDIILVESPLAAKYFKINLVFFVLGLFISIAIREFGKSSDTR